MSVKYKLHRLHFRHVTDLLNVFIVKYITFNKTNFFKYFVVFNNKVLVFTQLNNSFQTVARREQVIYISVISRVLQAGK